MKKVLAIILTLVAIAAATKVYFTFYGNHGTEVVRPAFALTESRRLTLEKIALSKVNTKLHFSVNTPGELPALDSLAICLLTDKGDTIAYEGADVTSGQDSVTLYFKALPRSAKTFSLVGYDKGWYGIRTDGKGYAPQKAKASEYPTDKPLPEYCITGGTAYIEGRFIGFVPDAVAYYFLATQDLVTGRNEVVSYSDSITGDFLVQKYGLHNHAVYCIFPGDATGDFWFFPGYRTTVTIDLPAIMAKKYELTGHENAGKGVTFGGQTGDISQVLWDLTHIDWQTVIKHDAAAEITYKEYHTIHWDTLQARLNNIEHSAEYNKRQKQLASLFIQKEYIRNIISYPSWLKNSLRRAKVSNVDSVYAIKMADYTLEDSHAGEIALFDRTSNVGLWVIRDASILPYALANGLTDNPATHWMQSFERAQEMCRAINMKPLAPDAPEWGNPMPPFEDEVHRYNDYMRAETARLEKELTTDVKVCSAPVKYEGTILDYIASEYKGKIVLVDCWATWCGPCKTGIEQIKEYKNELKDEPVAFVYLTNGSSPYETWSDMIKNISGYHYRLSNDDWNTIPSINGIPRYFLLDEKGNVVMDVAGWGKDSLERFKSKINGLLKGMKR